MTERLELAVYRVVEAEHRPAGDRRGLDKTDRLDATRIARAVLGLVEHELPTPRTLVAGDETLSRSRVALRVLVVTRARMTGERTRNIKSRTSLICMDDLGNDARTSLKGRS